MHLHSVTKILLSIVLAASDLIATDWVEIPFLQPSTTTQKSTVIRKNINQPSFLANSNLIHHVLPSAAIAAESSSAESEEDAGIGSVESISSNNGDSHRLYLRPFATATPPPGSRVSDLLDFAQFTWSSTSEQPVVDSFANNKPGRYANFQKRFFEHPRGNVSAGQELWFPPERGEHKFVTANRAEFPSHLGEDREPPSNKYEEESIEYLNPDVTTPHPKLTAQFVNHRVELPAEKDTTSTERDHSSKEKITNDSAGSSEEPPTEVQFPDFDDYDAAQEQLSNSFRNVSIVKRRRRPLAPGHVTIVRVIPPRRRLRPAGVEGEGGFSSFLKFLKRMQDRFMLKTAKNIGDKIRVLQNLRDQLLLSIENRISALWGKPSASDAQGDIEEPVGQRRVKRGGGWMDQYPTSGHGGMDFPSAEAALLTISFLTFAVFLIKLVLQVINTIKAKHYTYSTLTGINAGTGTTLKLVKRGKRSSPMGDLSNHNLDVLSAINNYKLT
ncbi:uncharacterized protein LOC131689947 [Topomyia yanbarensis]|uniref:uncharacterized protein LOC131689947 n=1 Tax=Topomyia yanbarensis TaxID=2498891 RepID=UPI00273C424C|nr:uncharacterized protein LOC131689947 [Topomyia yanbarensis]